MLFALLSLFSLALALPQQAVFIPSTPPPPELQGWFDPRINGGRLLDVCSAPLQVSLSDIN